jgi:hypothetical protein
MSKKNGEYFYYLMSNRDRMRFKGNVSSQDKNIDEIIKKDYNSFDDFLNQSFNPQHSLQGKTYWNTLSRQIEKQNKLKIIDLYVVIFLIIFFLIFLLFNN